MEAKLDALEEDHAQLMATVLECSRRLCDIKGVVETKLNKVGVPAMAWMDELDPDVAFRARLNHVVDPRRVSQNKLKKLGVARDQWRAMVDDMTRPTAAMIKGMEPWKSDESCWFQAQDELFGR